jgi:hypothetical protein
MRRAAPVLLLSSLAALSVPARNAEACGGTFCDSQGQAPMPVDQTGENILFVVDGQSVEAHVQIQYSGEPERFAWLVPMPVAPEVSAGSQALFTSLLAATVPRFRNRSSFDACASKPHQNSSGCGNGSDTMVPQGNALSARTNPRGGGAQELDDPAVVDRRQVGAFEIEVLSGGTAEGITAWLQSNGYAVPPAIEGFLVPYLEKGAVLVAIRLTAGAGSDEIHPIVFRYPGSEPCVPIRLTAVAARENMGLRAFFLSGGRFVPRNYKHVVINDGRIDWLGDASRRNLAGNYNEVVARAVDAPVANGRAFVTEYAGPSDIVSSKGLSSPNWKSSTFIDADPDIVPALLGKQNDLVCEKDKGCTADNPMVLSLLRRFLPVPAGVDEGAYYGCISCYAQPEDKAGWDGALFAQQYDERVVQPGLHAEDVLAEQPYLTRMFTAISPGEMTEDPEFFMRPDLPPVDGPAVGLVAGQGDPSIRFLGAAATIRRTCGGQDAVILPSGREVALPAGNTAWPQLPDQLPWAERVEEFPATGPAIVLKDNTAAIDEAQLAANKALGWPPPAPAEDHGDDEGSACSYGGLALGRRGTSAAVFALGAAAAMLRRSRRSSRRDR